MLAGLLWSFFVLMVMPVGADTVFAQIPFYSLYLTLMLENTLVGQAVLTLGNIPIYWANVILVTVMPYNVYWACSALVKTDSNTIPTHYPKQCTNTNCASYFLEKGKFPRNCRLTHVEHVYADASTVNKLDRLTPFLAGVLPDNSKFCNEKVDLRPDAMSLRDLRHHSLTQDTVVVSVVWPSKRKTMNFRNYVSLRGFIRFLGQTLVSYVFKKFGVVYVPFKPYVCNISRQKVSIQLVSQLKNPVALPFGIDSVMMMRKLNESIKGIHSVNVNRFKRLFGESIYHSSVLFSFGIAMHDQQKACNMPFRSPAILEDVSLPVVIGRQK